MEQIDEHHWRLTDQVELENAEVKGCLLYTSDAADERSSVDLGGRRIIKKKKSSELSDRSRTTSDKGKRGGGPKREIEKEREKRA